LNAAAECVRALVFSDVENSTAQVARLGATGAVELWAAHDRKGDDRARRARLRARAATPKPLAAALADAEDLARRMAQPNDPNHDRIAALKSRLPA
jgi:hypothetical protein